MSNEISNERLPEYKLLRFSSIGAIANPEEVQAMAKELLALRNAREGWHLVPIEPTDDMINAALASGAYSIRTAYSAMLAAAPTFPGETSKPYGWVAEYPTIPAGIGGITYSFHDNRADAQEEADAYNGHVVEVVRR